MLRLPSVTLAAILLAGPTPASSAGCFPAYSPTATYGAGDVVSASVDVEETTVVPGGDPVVTTVSKDFNFECVAGANAAFCSQGAFAPGGTNSDVAWIRESAECDDTVTPATAAPPAAWSGGGCPSAYVAGTAYDAGAVVSVADGAVSLVYECAAAPSNLFCGMTNYEPGEGPSADLVWTTLGSCDGTLAPTASPVNVALADAGGCPSAYDAAVTYEEGDRVSSEGFVYECMAFPASSHCSQTGYEPGTTVGTGAQAVEFWRDAWDVVGSCEGTIAPTTSPSFDQLADAGGCPLAYAAGTTYEEGDRVSSEGFVYECMAYPASARCGQAGYEPGTTIGDRDAWNIVGHCEGTIAPSASPTFDQLTDLGGCPDAWEAGVNNYEEGDTVADGSLVFACKAFPASARCGQEGFQPSGEPGAWEEAWTIVGHCSGSIGPTTSPTFDAAALIGACPDEWVAGSNTAYEEGDLVSVAVSEVPLRQVAFRCKAWPLSGFCGQFSPLESGGDQGWTLEGTCEGSIGPTASPSFDAIAAAPDAGCPAAWDPSTTDYEEGDRVSYSLSDAPARTLVFQCREWPNTGYCNQGVGFEPTSTHGNLAWTMLGTCEGTIAPTAAPVPYAGTCQFDKCVTAAVNGTDVETCTPTDVEPWSASVDYVTDDVVRLGVKQFTCREWPNFFWCRQAAYAPTEEEDGIWREAWIAGEDCPP